MSLTFHSSVEQTSFALKLVFLVLGVSALFVAWFPLRRATDHGERLEFLGNLGSGVGVYAISTLTFQLPRQWLGGWSRTESPLPSVATALVAFLVVDLANYGYHVLAHRFRLLWAMHVVHHSAQFFNVSVGLRQSWIERLFVTPLLYTAIFLPFCWGLGISIWYFIIAHQCVFFVAFMNHTSRLLHWPFGLKWLLMSPIEHRMHHGASQQYHDCNFGLALRCWDFLFGTYRRPEETPKIEVGVIESGFLPSSLAHQREAFGLLVAPLKSFVKQPAKRHQEAAPIAGEPA